MKFVRGTKLFIMLAGVLVFLSGVYFQPIQAQLEQSARPAGLHQVYLFWRRAMQDKNYMHWKALTSTSRRIKIQNRILSRKGDFPADIFKVPISPPDLKGLKLLRSRHKGPTAKLIYFGKVDFKVGGTPRENLLVLSFLYEQNRWKYHTSEFINLNALKDIRAALKSGDLNYLEDASFFPEGKLPARPIVVGRAKYIAQVYSYCPGREVQVSINQISSHRFQDTQQAEIIIGGARDGVNTIWYSIRNLAGYSGRDPMTLRVYLFSQIPGVKPIKVFEYQTSEGEKPRLSGSAQFFVSDTSKKKLLGVK